MKIIIPGGSGQVGSILARAFAAEGHEIVVLGRNPSAPGATPPAPAVRFIPPQDELTGHVGGCEPDAPSAWKFSIDVATAWEDAVNQADTPRTRKVLLRSAMVMSPDAGSIFDTLLTLVRRGLGGASGTG